MFEIDTEFISSGWHPIVRRGDPVLSTLPGDVALAGRRIAARFYTDAILPFKLPATLTYAIKYPVDPDMLAKFSA